MGKRAAAKDGVGPYCRECVNAEASGRRTRVPITERACLECEAPFMPVHHNEKLCSDGCRDKRNDRSKKVRAHARFVANRELYAKRKNRWYADHPDERRAMRKRSYRKHKKAERVAHDAWVAQNREYMAEYDRDYKRQAAAIADGKGNPAYRVAGEHDAGFCLVASLPGTHGRYYRASAFGDRVGGRECVIALYRWVGDEWVVRQPYAIAPGAGDIVKKVVRRELTATARKARRSRAAGARWENSPIGTIDTY